MAEPGLTSVCISKYLMPTFGGDDVPNRHWTANELPVGHQRCWQRDVAKHRVVIKHIPEQDTPPEVDPAHQSTFSESDHLACETVRGDKWLWRINTHQPGAPCVGIGVEQVQLVLAKVERAAKCGDAEATVRAAQETHLLVGK